MTTRATRYTGNRVVLLRTGAYRPKGRHNMVTLYLGSLWHQDNDPFVTVAGFNASEVEDKLDELEEEEFERLADDDDSDTINICTGGVHAETGAAFLNSFFPFTYHSNEAMSALDDLIREGITTF